MLAEMNVVDIYVSTTGYLLQIIYSSVQRNYPTFMLANPDYNNISIENYKWETFLTFMLALRVYVTCLLNYTYK